VLSLDISRSGEHESLLRFFRKVYERSVAVRKFQSARFGGSPDFKCHRYVASVDRETPARSEGPPEFMRRWLRQEYPSILCKRANASWWKMAVLCQELMDPCDLGAGYSYKYSAA
jgi:hypothetical protein